VLYRDARFLGASKGGRDALRAFDKAARTKPLVVAADAGPMEIEWGKTEVQSAPEAVQQSTTDGSGSWFVRRSIPETARRKLGKEICFAARRRGTEHAQTRGGFAFDRVVSCSGRDRRWRTKLDFCSGEPFNDHHRSTTLGTAPEIVRARDVLIGLRVRWCTE
jgi:hypothetical protein